MWREASEGYHKAHSPWRAAENRAPLRDPRRRSQGPAPLSRGAEQVDITQYFSDSTSALLQRAAQLAGEWGSVNLDDEHLLHAALEDGVVRRVVEEVDADADQIRAQIEEEAER